MASTIQVDKIQDTGGNTILSSNSTGTFTYEAASGANFTALDADNVSAGTLAVARGGSGRAIITGNILQVVQSTTTSNISTASTSYVATGFTGSITPTLSDSKILIQVAGGKLTDGGSGRIWNHMYTQTDGGGYSDLFTLIDDLNQSGTQYGQTFSGAYLHSPSTTTQVDYQMYIKVNAGTVYINNNSHLAVTMMEVAA